MTRDEIKVKISELECAFAEMLAANSLRTELNAVWKEILDLRELIKWQEKGGNAGHELLRD
jgi:hypothetical protein